MIDKAKISKLASELLLAFGEDPKREGLVGTPRRLADAYVELLAGYEMDPKKILATEFNEVTGIIVAKGIDFFSLCEHHLLPFFGTVHIGYIPRKSVVGVSKLSRVVECYSKRLQLQERMTRQITDSIDQTLNPLGVIVVTEATHLCMEMRGVKNRNSIIASELRGVFKNAETRKEFFDLLGK